MFIQPKRLFTPTIIFARDYYRSCFIEHDNGIWKQVARRSVYKVNKPKHESNYVYEDDENDCVTKFIVLLNSASIVYTVKTYMDDDCFAKNRPDSIHKNFMDHLKNWKIGNVQILFSM